MTVGHAPGRRRQAPARHRRARRPRRGDRPRHRQLRLRGPDPPRPPRHGAGAAARQAVPLRRPPALQRATRRARWSRAVPAPPAPRTSRAYVHYLSRAEELTGVRLLTPPQPRLHRRARPPGARGDRRGPVRRTTGGRSWPAPPPWEAEPLVRPVFSSMKSLMLWIELVDRVADELTEVGLAAGVGGEQDRRRRRARRRSRSGAIAPSAFMKPPMPDRSARPAGGRTRSGAGAARGRRRRRGGPGARARSGSSARRRRDAGGRGGRRRPSGSWTPRRRGRSRRGRRGARRRAASASG